MKTYHGFFSLLIDVMVMSYFYYLLKFEEDIEIVSIFGLANTFLLFSMSFLYGYNDLISINLSECFGSKQYKLATLVLFKIMIAVLIGCLLSLCLLLLSNKIMYSFGIEELLRTKTF